jgi:hypothetical protein
MTGPCVGAEAPNSSSEPICEEVLRLLAFAGSLAHVDCQLSALQGLAYLPPQSVLPILDQWSGSFVDEDTRREAAFLRGELRRALDRLGSG